MTRKGAGRRPLRPPGSNKTGLPGRRPVGAPWAANSRRNRGGTTWKKAARAAEPVAIVAATLALLVWRPDDAVRIVPSFVTLAVLVSIAWDIVRGMLPNGD